MCYSTYMGSTHSLFTETVNLFYTLCFLCSADHVMPPLWFYFQLLDILNPLFFLNSTLYLLLSCFKEEQINRNFSPLSLPVCHVPSWEWCLLIILSHLVQDKKSL